MPPLRVAVSSPHTHTYALAHSGDSRAAQVSPYLYHFNLSFSQGRLYETSSSCSRFPDTNMASPLSAVLRWQTDFRLLYLAAYIWTNAALEPSNLQGLRCILCFWSNKLRIKIQQTFLADRRRHGNSRHQLCLMLRLFGHSNTNRGTFWIWKSFLYFSVWDWEMFHLWRVLVSNYYLPWPNLTAGHGLNTSMWP